MEFAYNRPNLNILLDNLKNEVIAKTLAYMVDFKEHDTLVVIPKTHSIEISNSDICIAVILFSGFEKEEYEIIKTRNNHHVVSFDKSTQTLFEFENLPIKQLDTMALFFMALSRTADSNLKEFLHLRNPSAQETLLYLRKEYSLKEVVWNADLFSLIYKKQNTKLKSTKIKNKFATAIVLESFASAFTEENLKSIGSSLILEFAEHRKILANKKNSSELVQSVPLLICFAVASGRNRAKKAIKTALSTPMLNDIICDNTKNILLLISSNTIEITIDEIGIINDRIQERMGYNVNIDMMVNEDKNLKKSLAVTLMISQFEAEKFSY